jgi:iron(III) transport system substrate-binding protein
MHRGILVTATALALILATGPGAGAADLPKATQKALAELKLDVSVLDGLDAELAVPKAWLDGAAKEEGVTVFGTWNDRDFPAMTAAFKERYPFVNLRYNRTGTAGRGIRVLVALGEGRVIADVLTSIGSATPQFIEMKALADLRDLPGFTNLSNDYVAADGTWASYRLSFRCMAYNKEKVNKDDLPATWDDLVKSPRWRGGTLALANLPDPWMLTLWATKGEAWGAAFTRSLFDLQPQRRKEGMNATTALTVAGEADASIPAGEDRTRQYVKKGAPIGYHCPSPVPITVSQIGMLEKSPHKNGARIFINWMLSREGQLVQFAATFAMPVHKALQTPDFLMFADTINGKPHIVRDDAMLTADTSTKMHELWDALWVGGAGGGEKAPKPAATGEDSEE